jgi:hypothetical protein
VIAASHWKDHMGEREYASEQLLGFLGQVGPIEAQWAMQTALVALQDLPASEDHIAAVHAALHQALEVATVDDAGDTSISREDVPMPSASKASREAKNKAPA